MSAVHLHLHGFFVVGLRAVWLGRARRPFHGPGIGFAQPVNRLLFLFFFVGGVGLGFRKMGLCGVLGL